MASINVNSSNQTAVGQNPPSDDTSKKGLSRIDVLVDFLTKIMLHLVQKNNDQLKIASINNEHSNEIVDLLKKTLTDAVEKLTEYQKQQQEQSKQGWWQKAVGILAGAALAIAGTLTGQPELIVMSAFMIAMQGGGQEAIDSVLKELGPVGKICAEAAIGVALACVTGGISALSTTAEVAEITGAEAAEGALSSGAGAATDAAEATVGAVQQALQESSDVATEVQQSLFSQLKGSLFGKASAQLSKTLAMGNFWQDLFTRLGKDCGESDETAGIVGGITGTLMGLGTAYGCSKLDAERSFTGIADFFRARGVSTEGLTKLSFLFKAVGASASITGSALGISQGVISLNQADLQRKQGDDRFTQTLYNRILDVIGQITTQAQEGIKAAEENDTDILQSADLFLKPYDVNSVFVA